MHDSGCHLAKRTRFSIEAELATWGTCIKGPGRYAAFIGDSDRPKPLQKPGLAGKEQSQSYRNVRFRDETRQLTYDDNALYTFMGDKPGEANRQGVMGWYVLPIR